MKNWNLNLSNTRIIPFEFKYYEPSTLDEAVELLQKLGPDAKILAGGTDLLVQMKTGVLRPKYIINIKKIKELRKIEDRGDRLVIGALTRLRDIEKNSIVREKFYSLYEAVKAMASPQIRCMASVGGNLCNASPAADTAPPLMTYNAELVLSSINGERRVSIHDFFLGPRKTVLAKNELLKEIRLPVENNYGYSYIKLGRRTSFTLSIVSVATLVKIENSKFKDVRIALNSVAPTPVRAKSVEKYLIGREVDEEVISEASKLVVNDISPISDIRASADYRRKASIVLVHDSLIEAVNMLMERD